jgi:hypothetical protein
MNAERLHVIMLAVKQDLEETNLEETLEQLVSDLQQQIDHPQNAEFQQNVSHNLEALLDSLSAAPSNTFSHIWRQELTEMGVMQLLGTSLREQLQIIFRQNQITLSIALEKLRELHAKIASLRTVSEQMITGFEYLKIGAEELNPGQFELGIFMPRRVVDNGLEGLAKELAELNGVFGIFSEVTIRQRPEFKIRSFSSSEFMLYLEVIPVVATGITIAIDRIINSYKNLLTIRRHRQGLEDQKVPKKVLKGISEYADEYMKKIIA